MTYQIRHQTLASVIESIENSIVNKGYELPVEFSDITYWKHINYNSTMRENLQLTFNEGRKHNDGIVFQIYRTSEGNYELNLYYWR
jgi:hypothetical protein